MTSLGSELIRYGRSLFRWRDTDEAAVSAPIFKFHEAGDEREERVVFSLPDVYARLMPRAPLANQNRAGVDQLAAEALYAQPLSV